MKTKSFGILKAIATISACLTFAATARAATVYDNSVNPIGSFHPLTSEAGDQINLLAGLDRVVSTFQFEYHAALVGSGQSATVRFYANDGAGGAPLTELFNSGPFSLSNGSKTVTIQNLAVSVPDSFTWTVQFSGLAGGESAGLLVYNPPTVGSSLNDFWVKNGANWELNQLNGGLTPANFAARVVAVPEPSVIALVLLGGAFLLTRRGNRQA